MALANGHPVNGVQNVGKLETVNIAKDIPIRFLLIKTKTIRDQGVVVVSIHANMVLTVAISVVRIEKNILIQRHRTNLAIQITYQKLLFTLFIYTK
jgi:hypothetical protein